MGIFSPQTLVLTKINKPIYDHGYTEEEVLRIKLQREEIIKRDLVKFPVSLEEFKTIIVPWQRINRTEVFILNPIKEKKIREPKVPKEKKIKEPKILKEKKLTKKQIETKINLIIFNKLSGKEVTEEDEIFFNQYTTNTTLL